MGGMLTPMLTLKGRGGDKRPQGMSFWETMVDANAVAAEVLGESVLVGGSVVMAVVSAPMSIEDGDAPGGRRMVATGEITVPAGVVPYDGMACVVRGIECKVESWNSLGVGDRWVLQLGAMNRWSGDIPGA